MSFRRSAALALAAAALVSGCKKVTQEQSPQEFVIAAFNSPICVGSAQQCPTLVPTPNDLALQIIPKLPASAQRTLLQAFIDAGGFPSDQAVGITIPLKQLRFDAASGQYALTTPPLVDPASLTTGASPTFVVVRIDVNPPVVQAVEVDVENCTTGQIALEEGGLVDGEPRVGARALRLRDPRRRRGREDHHGPHRGRGPGHRARHPEQGRHEPEQPAAGRPSAGARRPGRGGPQVALESGGLEQRGRPLDRQRARGGGRVPGDRALHPGRPDRRHRDLRGRGEPRRRNAPPSRPPRWTPGPGSRRCRSTCSGPGRPRRRVRGPSRSTRPSATPPPGSPPSTASPTTGSIFAPVTVPVDVSAP